MEFSSVLLTALGLRILPVYLTSWVWYLSHHIYPSYKLPSKMNSQKKPLRSRDLIMWRTLFWDDSHEKNSTIPVNMVTMVITTPILVPKKLRNQLPDINQFMRHVATKVKAEWEGMKIQNTLPVQTTSHPEMSHDKLWRQCSLSVLLFHIMNIHISTSPDNTNCVNFSWLLLCLKVNYYQSLRTLTASNCLHTPVFFFFFERLVHGAHNYETYFFLFNLKSNFLIRLVPWQVSRPTTQIKFKMVDKNTWYW